MVHCRMCFLKDFTRFPTLQCDLNAGFTAAFPSLPKDHCGSSTWLNILCKRQSPLVISGTCVSLKERRLNPGFKHHCILAYFYWLKRCFLSPVGLATIQGFQVVFRCLLYSLQICALIIPRVEEDSLPDGMKRRVKQCKNFLWTHGGLALTLPFSFGIETLSALHKLPEFHLFFFLME